MFHQHSLAVDVIPHRDRQFIFGFDFEHVVDSEYNGVNTRAGQQICIKPAGASIPANEMADQMYITMFSDQILETKDLGLRVHDEIDQSLLMRKGELLS